LGRPLRVGLYSPYFGSTIGGGEKYLCRTAALIRDRFPDARVEIVSPVPADRERNERMLGVDLSGIELVATNRRVTSIHRFLNSVALLRPLRDRFLARQADRFTARYDVYLPLAFAIRLAPRRGPGAILCQFPYPYPGSELDGYSEIVCYSEYVRGWVREYWDREATVVHPPVEVPAAEPAWGLKERIVLSVGRFFATAHSKRQDVMVEAFKALCDAGLSGWELHLAGGVHRDAEHAGYYRRVLAAAAGYPIHVHADVAPKELEDLYARASLYWHAAGYGTPEDPATAEHFGMTTVEAMARGAVPIVFGRGGQVEVVTSGRDGFLWTSLAELQERTRRLAADAGLRQELARAARESSRRFSPERFEASMLAALEPVMTAALAEPARA